MHAPIPVPTRITIDFREAIQPGHGWIVGATPGTSRRIELLAVTTTGEMLTTGELRARPAWTPKPAVEPFAATTGLATTAPAECCCPEFCELDHANE
jgi:hypothetical protein